MSTEGAGPVLTAENTANRNKRRRRPPRAGRATASLGSGPGGSTDTNDTNHGDTQGSDMNEPLRNTANTSELKKKNKKKSTIAGDKKGKTENTKDGAGQNNRNGPSAHGNTARNGAAKATSTTGSKKAAGGRRRHRETQGDPGPRTEDGDGKAAAHRTVGILAVALMEGRPCVLLASDGSSATDAGAADVSAAGTSVNDELFKEFHRQTGGVFGQSWKVAAGAYLSLPAASRIVLSSPQHRSIVVPVSHVSTAALNFNAGHAAPVTFRWVPLVDGRIGTRLHRRLRLKGLAEMLKRVEGLAGTIHAAVRAGLRVAALSTEYEKENVRNRDDGGLGPLRRAAKADGGPRAGRYAVMNTEDLPKWKDLFALWRDAASGDQAEDGETWVEYRVTSGVVPPYSELKELDGMVVTGSHYNVCDGAEQSWIGECQSVLRECIARGHPRIVGGCFGCQLIASALPGGDVGKNPSGAFVIQTETIPMDKVAAAVTGMEWYSKGPSAAPTLNLLECHGDAILRLPTGAVLLAASSSCAHEVWAAGPSVICFQSHPELEPSHVTELILPAIHSRGLVDDSGAKFCRDSMCLPQEGPIFLRLVRSFLRGAVHMSAPPMGQAEVPEQIFPRLHPSVAEAKDAVRSSVWGAIEAAGNVKFPRPCRGRIPNFRSSEKAGKLLGDLPEFKAACTVKVNPSLAQDAVRAAVLRSEKTLLVPSPDLAAGFMYRLGLGHSKGPGGDEDKEKWIRRACGKKGTVELGEELGVDASGFHVDVLVVAAVAANPLNGVRLGKGMGYGELEYAVMKELGWVSDRTIVVTTVHEDQLVWDLSPALHHTHDLPVDIVVTPTAIHRVPPSVRPPRPSGVDWAQVDDAKLERMPVLQALKARKG